MDFSKIKEYFANPENPRGDTVSRGLGDTVEKAIHATGLHHIAEAYTAVTGNDCGCEARRDALNEIFPYKEK